MTSHPAWLNEVRRAGESHELMADWRLSSLPEARQSAVLMLFGADEGGGEDVVLTQRAATLRNHAGQVSFPGGRVEESDASLAETALRESAEEIGLVTQGVQILGQLAPIPLSVSNFVVNPVLAWWHSPGPIQVVDTNEVERVARVRVADLVDPQNRHTATHPRGFAGPAFEVDGLYIWGFTAYLLDAVLTAGGQTRQWDVSDRRQVPDRFLR